MASTWHQLILGGAYGNPCGTAVQGRKRRVPMMLDAPGAAVVPSTRPDTFVATAEARAQREPVNVFDPRVFRTGRIRCAGHPNAAATTR